MASQLLLRWADFGLVSELQHTRTYRFHRRDLRISCSSAVASSLDARFRLLASTSEQREIISFDFHTVPDASRHCLEKPQGRGFAFYELPSGEARYFQPSDQLYLSFRDGVRALSRHSCVCLSLVESDPVNLFMASHLMFTILLVEILKRRGFYSMHAAGFSQDGKAILIPGTSGAGKSTLAITLLRSGFGYLSDDMVFLRRHSGGIAGPWRPGGRRRE
jgi:hypothetical protein